MYRSRSTWRLVGRRRSDRFWPEEIELGRVLIDHLRLRICALDDDGLPDCPLDEFDEACLPRCHEAGEVIRTKQPCVYQMRTQPLIHLPVAHLRILCPETLGADPPMIRFVRADSGVLLMIESNTLAGIPCFLHQS